MNAPAPLVLQKRSRNIDAFAVILSLLYVVDRRTLDLTSWGFTAISWIRLYVWIRGH